MSSPDLKQKIAQIADVDAVETQEWLEALEAVLDREGPERAHFLLEKLIDLARRSGSNIPFSPHTAYVNTIPPGLEPPTLATWPLKNASARMCAGMPWPWL